MTTHPKARYEQLLAALRSDEVAAELLPFASVAERKDVLTRILSDTLAQEGLALTDVFEPSDLSLLDAPVDADTMQLRLNLQIQLQVLKRPSVASQPAPSEREVRAHAFQGKSLE